MTVCSRMPRTLRSALAGLTATALLVASGASLAGQTPRSKSGAQRVDPTESYSLTLDNVKKTTAVNKMFVQKAKTDPAFVAMLQKHSGATSGDRTLEEGVKIFESEPAVNAALKAGGITARDYLLTELAGMGAAMMAAVIKSGAAKPGAIHLSPAQDANLQFAQAHSVEMKALTDSMEEMGKIAEKEQ